MRLKPTWGEKYVSFLVQCWFKALSYNTVPNHLTLNEPPRQVTILHSPSLKYLVKLTKKEVGVSNWKVNMKFVLARHPSFSTESNSIQYNNIHNSTTHTITTNRYKFFQVQKKERLKNIKFKLWLKNILLTNMKWVR